MILKFVCVFVSVKGFLFSVTILVNVTVICRSRTFWGKGERF